jgi:hypothetical protein
LYKAGDYFYVTFHGYNGKNGIRAATRTKDFNNWESTGPGLPGRPMFGPADCAGWRVPWNGGCIGSGHASTLVTPQYHYMLIEAADLNLSCTANQNWVLGLVRAPQLAGSGGWESYAANPIVQNLGTKAGCALQYQHLLEDRGSVFIYFGYAEAQRPYPNKLFKVVPGPGAMVIRINSSSPAPRMPTGSYWLSCFDCSLNKNSFACSCRNTQGETVVSQLDLTTCASKTSLNNIDGHLQCPLR